MSAHRSNLGINTILIFSFLIIFMLLIIPILFFLFLIKKDLIGEKSSILTSIYLVYRPALHAPVITTNDAWSLDFNILCGIIIYPLFQIGCKIKYKNIIRGFESNSVHQKRSLLKHS